MSASEHYKRVKKFMTLAGQETPERPKIPPAKVRVLRSRILLEEVLETFNKGFGVVLFLHGKEIKIEDVEFAVFSDGNIEEIADGSGDISVVNTGNMVACGIKDEKLLEEIDKNNLEKFGPGHRIREDGKLIKPPDHRPPNIAKILEEQ